MATERNPYDKIPSAEVIKIPEQGANIEIGETVSFDIEEDGGVVVSFENEFEYGFLSVAIFISILKL